MWVNHKRKIIITLSIILSIGAIIYFARIPIALALLDRALATRMGEGPDYKRLPPGLHLVLCGAGAPLPDIKRSGPCIGLVVKGDFGEDFFVFDAGTNGARNLVRMGWSPGLVKAVFLTHFHSDHIDGLGELSLLRWTSSDHDSPLPVYGGKGIKQVVDGFNLAYKLDSKYRAEHHGADLMVPKASGMVAKNITVPKLGETALIWNKNGIKISAFQVEHAPIEPALGYRIEYEGRVIVISGDTKKSAALQKITAGADLLAHEALSPKLVGVITKVAQKTGNKRIEKITNDILNYHTTPIEAAEIARDAGVKHLLLYHLVPAMPIALLENVFIAGIDKIWSGGFTLGTDGTLISLPTTKKDGENNQDIIVDELF